MEFGRWYFDLHLPTEKGDTMFQRYSRFSQRTGKPHPGLTPPPLDKAAGYIWQMYKELDEARVEYQPFTWTELHAWTSLTHRRLSRWEVKTLRRIDVAVCNTYHRKQHGSRKPST